MAHKWDMQERSADALEGHHFQAVCPETPPFRSAVRGDSLIMTASTGRRYTAKLEGTEAKYKGDPGITTVSLAPATYFKRPYRDCPRQKQRRSVLPRLSGQPDRDLTFPRTNCMR